MKCTTDSKLNEVFNDFFKYIQIDYKTPVEETAKYLFENKCVGEAKIILSITGGTKNFRVDTEIKRAFKIGLIKAAKTTDSWIISGGTDNGVMKLVGDAIDEDITAHDLTVLGIVSQKYTNRKCDRPEKFLNPNHSFFIIINEEINTPFNEIELHYEIQYRTKLEKHINDEYKIPVVLICVEGGFSALESVFCALENNIPILLLAVNKIY